MKTFTIKNDLVIPLVNWLSKLKLSGKDSRQRTRFINLFSERAKEIQAIREDLAKKYSKKDEKGEAIMREETVDGKLVKFYDLIPEEEVKANKELTEYLNEDFIVDIGEAHKDKIKAVKRLVLDTDEIFQGQSAIIYNQWCELFE